MLHLPPPGARAVLACALAAALCACRSTTPRLDREFGQAVRLATAQQVLDPAAARNARAPAGIDGQAAKSAYDNYQKSFREPAPVLVPLTVGKTP